MAISLSQSPSILLLVLLGATYLSYHLINTVYISYRRYLFKRERGCKPPPKFPQTDRILGSDIFFENLNFAKNGGFLEMVQRRYARVGAYTYSLHIPGQKFIQTAEPENIKAMLATQFKDFELPAMRKDAFAPVFGHGIFTTDGAEWETSRSLLRPNFNRAQVADLDMFERHVSKVIARIPRDGSTVDLQTLFFMLTMDSATEFLFGQSAGSLDPGQSFESGMRFADAFTHVTTQTGTIVRVPKPFAFLLKNKKYRADVKYVHEYVSSYVQKAVNLDKRGPSEKSDRYVFLEELAKTGFGEKKIQDELLNILLAGRDTTAALLSFLFYTLAREPKVFNKLQAEISVFDGRRPTYEQVKGFRYLQWVLNESLRLFPIVAINSRAAVRDTTLPVGGGPDFKSPVFIAKGQSVNYAVYAMHRRKDIYGEDALEFKPERWETLRAGWGYLPFNGGPRICIGQQFALMEASYTTIRILQTFKAIEKRDDSPFLEALTVTASVRGGVQVALTPR